MNFELQKLGLAAFSQLDFIWTFFLTFARYSGLMIALPGIGYGQRGLIIRFPMIVVLTVTSMFSVPSSNLPADVCIMAVSISAEFLFGFIVGLVPAMIVAGVQMGAQLASTTMGLSASQLFDPTLGTSVSDLARIYSDLVILMFLLLGGHYAVISALAEVGGNSLTNMFAFESLTPELIIKRSADIFRIGVMISAPVVVALLLTQFVMGMVSKAVPTVNIFIVSFPLTVGIGLIMSILALPEVIIFVEKEMLSIETTIEAMTQDVAITDAAQK